MSNITSTSCSKPCIEIGVFALYSDGITTSFVGRALNKDMAHLKGGAASFNRAICACRRNRVLEVGR